MRDTFKQELAHAQTWAQEAGEFLKSHFHDAAHIVDETSANDIKLRLDKECQTMIEGRIRSLYPADSILGEEGSYCVANSAREWIVDPLDGTVNYFYGIPIYCVSIALRVDEKLVLGCIYDPMQQELYTAIVGQGAFCNTRPIKSSQREQMSEAIIFAGHGRHDGSHEAGLKRFGQLSSQVKKVRILGSAALSLCYIAAGRFDAYIEARTNLWDIAAAHVILSEAGGSIQFTPQANEQYTGSIIAWNGHLPLLQCLAAIS